MKWFTKGSAGGQKIYLDYASLTPVDPRAAEEVVKIEQGSHIANPSAIHSGGVLAKKILETSRAGVAAFLHAHTDEIFFTASGTEANNIAIRGVIDALKTQKNENAQKNPRVAHILVSAIEHASVLETVKSLSSQDASVSVDFIPVNSDGIIDLDAFKKMLRPETALVSVMTVNNEIGTIQPIREAVKIVRDFNKSLTKNADSPSSQKIFFHTDACQAPLYLDMDMEKIGVDLLTLDSNKVYGPRGAGILYKRRSLKIGKDILPILTGGGQENGLRPGTENVPAIAGFAKALAMAKEERERESARLLELRNYFTEELKSRIPGIIFNGSYAEGKRLPNNINVTFPGKDFDHEFFLLQLDARGIACSTKSACLRDEDESYVLRAIRSAISSFSHHSAHQTLAQSIRFSLGRFTTKKDIDYTLKMIDEIMSRHI